MALFVSVSHFPKLQFISISVCKLFTNISIENLYTFLCAFPPIHIFCKQFSLMQFYTLFSLISVFLCIFLCVFCTHFYINFFSLQNWKVQIPKYVSFCGLFWEVQIWLVCIKMRTEWISTSTLIVWHSPTLLEASMNFYAKIVLTRCNHEIRWSQAWAESQIVLLIILEV